MPYVLPGDTATRRLRGDYIMQNFPLPYSSLPSALPPTVLAKQLSGHYRLEGTTVPAIWQEPPYRQGVGIDVAGAVDWVKQNPLIFAAIALGAVLALKGKRRR